MRQLVVDYDASHVRVYFRIYFFVIFIIVSLIGNQCLATRVHRKLAQKSAVPLPLMSGWLSGYNSIVKPVTIRTLPGGWLGVLMILGYLLNLGSDLATALIVSKTVHDRCVFGTGMVLGSRTLVSTVPPSQGKPFITAIQAQQTSQANDGLTGIYRKVNNDTRFSADDLDVLGGWICIANNTALEYAPSTTVGDVMTDVVQRGLLYPLSLADLPSCLSNPIEGGWSHLVLWDTSANEELNVQFDVRAVIDLAPLGNETKVLQAFDCQLNSSNGTLLAVEKSIRSKDTLNQYCFTLQGSIYNGWESPAASDTANIIAHTLNAMTMVAGGVNYLLDTTAANATQGCLTSRTMIPWELLLLTAAIAALVLVLLIFWLVNHVWIRMLTNADNKSRIEVIKECSPMDIFEWMAQTIREYQVSHGAFANKVETKDVKRWYFGKDIGHAGVGLLGKVAATGEECLPLVDPSSSGVQNVSSTTR